MGNVQGPIYPPYYEEIRDFTHYMKYAVSHSRSDYLKQTKPIPISYNTCVLRILHLIFIIGVICDMLIPSIYASPFLLFSTKINEDDAFGFMGDHDVAFLFIYIFTFLSFIGLAICLCHFCSMIFWDSCFYYGPSILCKCEQLLEDVICNGYVPLVDIKWICIFCSIFFLLFCISPALILYIGVCLFCRHNAFVEMSYNSLNSVGKTADPTWIQKAGQLRQRMVELNPNHDEIKTLFMKAVVHALYSLNNLNEHKSNCRKIIMHRINSGTAGKNDDELLDKMFDFYRGKVSCNEYVNQCSCSEACLYSGCCVWIILYVVIVTVFLLCYGFSENNNNNFLWMYYVVSYSIFLILFLFIVLLHYLDPLCRMKQHFGWTANLQFGKLSYGWMGTFANQTIEIWNGGERYIHLQKILEQKWLVRLIMEYTEFGDMNTWPIIGERMENEHLLVVDLT